jgi:hypothetical protein
MDSYRFLPLGQKCAFVFCHKIPIPEGIFKNQRVDHLISPAIKIA